jgi:hypothetical protein
MMINIAYTFFEFTMESDFEDTRDVFDDYIGDNGPNDAQKMSNRFVIHFYEGFFAEGKSSKIQNWQEKNEAIVEEFSYFIRGVTSIDDKDILTHPDISFENKNVFDHFVNGTQVVLTSMRIFNLVRHGQIKDIENECVIHVDRGLFSRLYFQEGNCGLSPRMAFNNFYGPLCIFHDVLQSVFVGDTQSNDIPLIKVSFEHTFIVNTMRDHEKDWRKAQSGLRKLEFYNYPTREIEIDKRFEAYEKIIYLFPSLINTLTNCLLVETEDKTSFQFTLPLSKDEKEMEKETEGYDMMVSDFVQPHSFDCLMKTSMILNKNE